MAAQFYDRLEYFHPDQLKPSKRNPRTHSDKQLHQIASSIRRFGFLVPVLINDDLELIVGHARVLAAKLLGAEKVPALRVGASISMLSPIAPAALFSVLAAADRAFDFGVALGPAAVATAKAKHAIITTVLSQATLHEDRVELTLSPTGLAETPPLRLLGSWRVHCTARRVFSVLGLSGLLGRGVLMGWLMHFWAQLTVTDQRSLL